MLVNEAIELLQKAELHQLSIKDDEKAIIGFINLGIVELHKRFNLWEETAVITTAEGKSSYSLDGTDTDVVFEEQDAHEILFVIDAEDEDGVSLIDNIEPKVKVPRHSKIRVSDMDTGSTITVSYRACPPYLKNQRSTIPLPFQFTEALFHYVGYRAHGSLRGDIKAENNTHYMRFEQSCAQIEAEGLYNQKSLESSKLYKNGFAL